MAARVAACESTDRVRGMMFNELLALVNRQLGAEGVAKVRAVLPPDAKYRDLVSYPISDFLKLMFAAADLLEAKMGSVELAIRACGAATVDAFARTPGGRVFFGVLSLAGPSQLLARAQTGYTTVVTYGRRSFTPSSDSSGTIVMHDDMQPVAYHEGVLEAVLRNVGYDGTVRGKSIDVNTAEYSVSWKKKAA
ncbi:MAG: TIGR02265 family protein [Archangium sp.]